METSKAYSEHYRTRSNRSASDNHLRIAGKQYEHGIGTHAPGQFCIDLDGKGLRFTAMVRIDDETNGQGSSAFKLIGDGRVLWCSEIIRGGQPPVKVDVDISGVKLLELIVTEGDDGRDADHADWVDAKFIMQGRHHPKAVFPPRDDGFGLLQKQIRQIYKIIGPLPCNDSVLSARQAKEGCGHRGPQPFDLPLINRL
jgi:hypothetical protein